MIYMDVKEHDIIRMLAEVNFWGRENIYTGIPLPGYAEKITGFANSAIVAVVGPRRSGKNNLCLQALESAIKGGLDKVQTLYINFEDPLLEPLLGGPQGIEAIYKSYRSIVNKDKPALLVLDEIQAVPRWEKWVRAANEKGRDIKIIITGSSSKLL